MPRNKDADDAATTRHQEADLAGAAEQLPEHLHGGLHDKIKRTKQGVRNDACLDDEPDERGPEGTGEGEPDQRADKA
jgi:hypothetical protein